MRNKIILTILFLSMIALIFSGCGGSGTVPNITQNGSISGRIMVPDNFKKDTEGWNCPLTGANVDVTDSEGKKHVTTTDKDGYYTIFDVAPGYNYIITAEGTKKGNAIVLKDVAVEVKEGENYNAGTADAESTTITLVLENIMENPEVEIDNVDVDNIKNCENFNEALSIVSNTINSGENVLTSSAVSASIEAVDVPNSIIEPLPEEKKAGIMGRLIDGILDTAIANGYVFLIGSNGDILDYTTTLDAGAGPDSGNWQFSSLPFGEKVTIVGFHPKYKFNMAMGDFDLDVQFKDIGRFETFCAMNEDFIEGGAGVPIGLTSLILTIIQNIAATALNNQAIALASYLLFEIGYYDEFEIISGNVYNVSPLPEFFELGKEYSTDVFAQNTGDKEVIFRIIPSHEVVDKGKNRSKVTSGINFDPEFRVITLKPGKSGSRNFKFTFDTHKADRIIKFSLHSYRDYISDWELVGEDYEIPLSFTASDQVSDPVHNLTKDTYYNTILYALNDADSNNTIEVSDGIYDEKIVFPPYKKIILQSVNGASLTIIRGDDDYATVNAYKTLEGTTIEGFTITHADGLTGAGINLNKGNLSINNCIISGNTAGYTGGGIKNFYGNSLTITGSTISGNTAEYNGGGIFNSPGSSLTITGSTISGNTAGYHGGGIFIPSNSGTMSIGGDSADEKNTLCGNSKSGYNPSLDQQIGTAAISGSLYETYKDTNYISAYCE